jgi:hypothetical protein
VKQRRGVREPAEDFPPATPRLRIAFLRDPGSSLVEPVQPPGRDQPEHP